MSIKFYNQIMIILQYLDGIASKDYIYSFLKQTIINSLVWKMVVEHPILPEVNRVSKKRNTLKLQ